MSIYSWQLPPQPLPPGGGGALPGSGISTATARSLFGALTDQEIDPVSLDYLRTTAGEWSETADSRTIVLVMLEMRFGGSYEAPTDGTRIKSRFEDGDPVDVLFVVAETTRAMGILERAGVLREFSLITVDASGNQLVDASGRFSPILSWTDLASGSPIDLQYAIYQG